MKVSKDQHLKAERTCPSAAATEWSVTRDQTPGANLRISRIHIHTSLGQQVLLKINVGFAKVRRKIFFAKMAFSTWKNLEQPSYKSLCTYIIHTVFRKGCICCSVFDDVLRTFRETISGEETTQSVGDGFIYNYLCRHILCIIFNYSTIEVKQMRCFGSNCSDIDWPRPKVSLCREIAVFHDFQVGRI